LYLVGGEGPVSRRYRNPLNDPGTSGRLSGERVTQTAKEPGRHPAQSNH